MSIYFKNGAFFLENINSSIPEDAVVVSQETYDAMFEGQANGQMIFTGDDGGPELMDKPLPSREVMVEIAEQNRQSLIDSAMQSVSVLQLKLQAGRQLNADEMTQLNAVLDYIDSLGRLDLNENPSVAWPNFSLK
ncbi:TPA: tail fiber assembly protein [Escherichia coli]|nr:phage tail protein [Escherichia coli]HCP8724295.1 tail fiber assembly protein [Escherichia coli]